MHTFVIIDMYMHCVFLYTSTHTKAHTYEHTRAHIHTLRATTLYEVAHGESGATLETPTEA